MSRLDFGSIYKEEKFDYIHSHTKYFHLSLEKRGIDLKNILASIKSNFIAELEKDIKRFQAMEDSLARSFVRKNKGRTFKEFPTEDRAGLLQYMKTVKGLVENQDNALNALIGLKNNSLFMLQESNSVVVAIEALFKKYTKDLPTETRTRELGDGKKKTTTFIDKKELNNRLKENPELKKEYDKKMKELKNKAEKNAKSSREELEKYLKIVIEYTASLLDPTVETTVHSDRTLKTAATNFLNTLKEMGVDISLTGPALEENITQAITNMGPTEFFSTFLNESKTKAYLGGQIYGFNTNSEWGTINEKAKIDAYVEIHANKAAHSVPILLGSKNIVSTGTNTLVNTSSTMDMSFARKSQGKTGEIVFGSSLKLVAKTSKIDTTIAEELWIKQLENFLGQKNTKNYKYLRKNIISLSSFVREGKKVKTSLQDFVDFEREILFIIGAIRLTIGIYEKVKKQVQSAGQGKGGGKLFYTMYLFTGSNVLSMSDILQAIVNEFKTKGLGQKIIAKGDKVWKQNPTTIDKDMLEELWKKKEAAIEKFWINDKRLTYKEIMSDQDVANQLLRINEFLGDFSFKDGIGVSVTESNLENYIK